MKFWQFDLFVSQQLIKNSKSEFGFILIEKLDLVVVKVKS